MPSPFPGMNPYLEQPAVWQDFHHRLITRIGDALTTQIRPQFVAKIEEYVFIHEPSDEERRKMLFRPDVAVVSGDDGSGVSVATTLHLHDTARSSTDRPAERMGTAGFTCEETDRNEWVNRRLK